MILNIILGLFISFTSPNPKGPTKDSTLVGWSENYKLVWADFKAPVNRGTGMSAISSTGISLRGEQKANIYELTVSANFDRVKSWVKDSTPIILAHEQLHFDLAEIYARKIRKECGAIDCQSSHLGDAIQKVYEKNMAELNKEQDRYDEETNHSINFDKQVEWELNIQKELTKYSEYASEKVDIEIRY